MEIWYQRLSISVILKVYEISYIMAGIDLRRNIYSTKRCNDETISFS